MSIELEWHKLDVALAEMLVNVLNRHLVLVQRPSFIGPVEITSFDFGTAVPEVDIVDLRDIHPDFAEDDSDVESEQDGVKVTERGVGVGVGSVADARGSGEEGEGYEWVSRRTTRGGLAEDALAYYHHLPPHVRYGRSPATNLFAMTPARCPGPSRDQHWGWSLHASSSSLSSLGHPASCGASSSASRPMQTLPPDVPSPVSASASASVPAAVSADTSPSAPATAAQQTEHPPSPPRPDLQVHLHVNWHSNLRLMLTTSLLINYPSPSFMVLPIKLSVTGLVFTGEVAVAFEGSKRRVHLCILDDLDPYTPASRRPRSEATTPSDVDDETGARNDGKPLPVGQRLLPSIFIESEIGQADKHILKNVTRVEKFIQDVIRKTIEEELVFPNFHTLMLGSDPSR